MLLLFFDKLVFESKSVLVSHLKVGFASFVLL